MIFLCVMSRLMDLENASSLLADERIQISVYIFGNKAL